MLTLKLPQMQPTLIPYLSIRPGQVTHYSKYEYTNKRSSRRTNPYGSNKTKEQKEQESRYRVVKRIKQCVTSLYESSKEKTVFSLKYQSSFKFKVNFITLTLPEQQKESDKDLHNNVFKMFIRAWKAKEPNLLYVYRAETQANGNLHYHLLTNSFLHHRDLRNIWNKYLYKAGYTKHDNPNSTDVHSLKNAKDPAAYISKYMTKKDESRRQVEIKEWDCSKALKAIKPIIIELPTQELLEECKRIHKRYKSTKKYDYCWIQKVKKEWLSITGVLQNLYNKLLQEVILINLQTNSENLVV